MWKWIKYYLIIMKSVITNKSVVTLFGASYCVAGNVVVRISK